MQRRKVILIKVSDEEYRELLHWKVDNNNISWRELLLKHARRVLK